MQRFMSDWWLINTGGRVYGPYSAEQMRTFAGEGRLALQSVVARAGSTNFHPVRDEPDLAMLFVPVEPVPAATPAPSAASPAKREEPVASFGRHEDRPRGNEKSHFIICSDMKSGSITRLEEEIFKLGQAIAILPQVWLLNTDSSINATRNLLVQQLGKLDTLFVADATNDKAAWFNFGPEADARIRKIWRTEQKLKVAS
ncbi:MAG TPA: DUF4339 domain-containing protein [Rhizomicrobium sp.]|jgi:hypothetical protein